MRKWFLISFVLLCFVFPMILPTPAEAQWGTEIPKGTVTIKAGQEPTEQTSKQEPASILRQILEKLSLWNRMLNQPVWYVILLVGVTITILLTKLPPLAGGVVRYILTGKSAIEGDWYAYHYTYMEGEPQIIRSYVRVRRGIRVPLVADLSEDVESKLHYKGKIIREQGQLIFYYESTDHNEIVINRFLEPLGKHCKMLFGCWLSFDHDKNIACGGILLSQEEIVNNIESILSRGFDLQRNKPLIRMKPKVLKKT